MNVITPYIGTDSIKFSMSVAEVRDYLKTQKIRFNTELWPNKGCTPEVAWDIIRVGDFYASFLQRAKCSKCILRTVILAH